jgi:uncharacterized protein (DUF2164 family)
MANFDLSKLMEGRNPQQVMLAETRQLKSKWEKTGLLEGLKEREQHSMAVLLENQAKQLLDEATQTGTGNASGGSEEWSGVALPLVRRIFGEIAAKEFVSVQPMNLPSGLVFFLDFKYGTSQAGQPGFNGKSLFGGNGGSAANDADFGRTDAAVNGLYGNGRYGFSINDTETSAVTIAHTTGIVSASWSEIGFDGALSASCAAGQIVKLTVPAASFTRPDANGISAFVVSGSEASNPYHKPAAGEITNFGQFAYVSGTNYIFFVSASAGAATTGNDNVIVKYHQQPTAAVRGDFEDESANGTTITALDIPEIDLELRSEAIVAKTRKLKAVWTPELAQDLNAYHSIDAEAELTSMLSDYISLEIDLEILDMLKSNALTVDYWSATIGEEYLNNGATGQAAWGSSVPSGANTYYTKNSWYQTLGVKINKVSNKIHQLTLRGGANFLVASPDVCTILESIPGFTVNADKDALQFAAGVTAVGSMSNRYTVYKNPYMTSNEILLGFRGNNFLETGAVYAPYVPLIMTPLVYDPQNFTPRRGVMTRYAKKMVRPEFYGKILVKDLSRI